MNETIRILSEKEARPIWKKIKKLIDESNIIEIEIGHELIEIMADEWTTITDHLYSGITNIKIRIKAKVKK